MVTLLKCKHENILLEQTSESQDSALEVFSVLLSAKRIFAGGLKKFKKKLQTPFSDAPQAHFLKYGLHKCIFYPHK
jgi:hypothetical protein